MTVSFSPTSWTGATAIDTAQLNRMETGINDVKTAVNAALPLTGGTLSSLLVIARALSGAAKIFLAMNATDGKQYSLQIDTSGRLNFSNDTDGVTPLQIGPLVSDAYVNGAAIARFRTAGGGSAGVNVWVGTTDPSSFAGEGDIWYQG